MKMLNRLANNSDLSTKVAVNLTSFQHIKVPFCFLISDLAISNSEYLYILYEQ